MEKWRKELEKEQGRKEKEKRKGKMAKNDLKFKSYWRIKVIYVYLIN